MIKKLTGLVAMVAFIGVAAPATMTGCSKKTGCKAFCERMKKCSDSMAEMEAKGMPKEALAKMKEGFKKEYGDTAKCTKQCKKHADKKEKKKMNECLAKSGCEAFAKCLKKG